MSSSWLINLIKIESNVAVVLHGVGGIRAHLDSIHRRWVAVCTVDSERGGTRKLYHVRPVRPDEPEINTKHSVLGHDSSPERKPVTQPTGKGR